MKPKEFSHGLGHIIPSNQGYPFAPTAFFSSCYAKVSKGKLGYRSSSLLYFPLLAPLVGTVYLLHLLDFSYQIIFHNCVPSVVLNDRANLNIFRLCIRNRLENCNIYIYLSRILKIALPLTSAYKWFRTCPAHF